LERLPLDKNVVRVFHNGGVLDTLQDLRDDAAKCADASLWALSDTDLITAVDQVHALQQTITAVLLHLVREADARDIPAAQHCRGTAVWLRSRLLLDAGTARRLVDQAAALARHPAVDAALCSGTIHVGQASAITDALDALPSAAALDAVPATIGDDATAAGEGVHIDSRTAPEVAAAAEAALLDLAAEFPPAPLRRLGARILDHVAPQVAERLDEKALERERRAWQARGLTLSPPSGGMVRISGHLTIEDAATITATLDPLSFPAAGDDDSRSPAQRRADALVEVCRLVLRTGDLPASGGEPPQLAVTVAYDPLARRLGVGRLDGGERVSPTAARRIACDAQILPFVMGGSGQVLDAGRARRLATGPLRRALVVRDRGCAFPDCDRQPRGTDAHHVSAWTAGGVRAWTIWSCCAGTITGSSTRATGPPGWPPTAFPSSSHHRSRACCNLRAATATTGERRTRTRGAVAVDDHGHEREARPGAGLRVCSV
jgi:Domain of unknown function (DUF222)